MNIPTECMNRFVCWRALVDAAISLKRNLLLSSLTSQTRIASLAIYILDVVFFISSRYEPDASRFFNRTLSISDDINVRSSYIDDKLNEIKYKLTCWKFLLYPVPTLMTNGTFTNPSELLGHKYWARVHPVRPWFRSPLMILSCSSLKTMSPWKWSPCSNVDSWFDAMELEATTRIKNNFTKFLNMLAVVWDQVMKKFSFYT